MIGYVLGGLLVVVALGVAWARIAGGRRERRSVEGYERALGVLGEVTKRGDQPEGVRILPPEEVGHPHVRPAAPGSHLPPPALRPDVPRPRRPLEPPSPSGPRARLEPPVPSGPPQGGLETGGLETGPPLPPWVPVGPTDGGDGRWRVVEGEGGAEAPPPEPPARGRGTARPAPHRVRARELRGRRRRTVGSLVAAAVVLVAAALAGVELAGSGRGVPPSAVGGAGGSAPAATAPRGGGTGSTGTTPTSTTTTVPRVLTPTSTSATNVSYVAPSGSYDITFAASGGPCWVGVRQDVGGPWLWMQTVPPGSSASYAASGTVVVTLGAPAHIAVAVNGVPVQLPPGYVQPYDVSFVVGGTAAA
jgi:hypothetical protein